MTICSCRKYGYASRAEAKKALERVRASARASDPRELDVYACPAVPRLFHIGHRRRRR